MEIIAILLSPVIAVAVTLWWQHKKEKRDAKIRLFTTLMAFRRSYPVSYEWAHSLNLIDVVFSGSPKVLEPWHKYFDNLEDKNPQAPERRVHLYLELMSAMAKELGFHKLQQTDIDKFYVPQAHGDQADLNYKIQKEFLRVLEQTSRFETSPIAAAPAGTLSSATVPKPPHLELSDIPPIGEKPRK